MKFFLIDEEKTHHSVSRLASVLGVSRAGYYASRKRGLSKRRTEDEELKVLIAEIHAFSFSTYGAPRIHAELAQVHGIRVGKKSVARLMKELRIEGVGRRKKGRAGRQASDLPPAPDLMMRVFSASRTGELFLSDITYIPTSRSLIYLALIIDVCTRRCCE